MSAIDILEAGLRDLVNVVQNVRSELASPAPHDVVTPSVAPAPVASVQPPSVGPGTPIPTPDVPVAAAPTAPVAVPQPTPHDVIRAVAAALQRGGVVSEVALSYAERLLSALQDLEGGNGAAS